MKLHNVILTLGAGILAMMAFYYRTEVDRDAPTDVQAVSFLENLLQQEVSRLGAAAAVDMIAPDGQAIAGHPDLLADAETIGCPSTDADYIDTRAGRFYDSDYHCLYRVSGPEGLHLYLAAYVTRSEDVTLRHRVDGYGFRLLSDTRIQEVMNGLSVQLVDYDEDAQRALTEQLDRLGFDIPGAPDQGSPFGQALENL